MKKNQAATFIIFLVIFTLGLHLYLFFFNKKSVTMGEPSYAPVQMRALQENQGPRSIHRLARGITFIQNDHYLPLEEAQQRVLLRELLEREELRKELKKNVEILKGALTAEQTQYIIKIQYDQRASGFTVDLSSTASVERQAVQKTIETLKNDGQAL